MKILAALLFGKDTHRHKRIDEAIADNRADAHPRACEFLCDKAVLECAKTETAVLLGNHDAEVAELGQFVADTKWNLSALGVELIGDRQHLVSSSRSRAPTAQAGDVPQSNNPCRFNSGPRAALRGNLQRLMKADGTVSTAASVFLKQIKIVSVYRS